MNNNAILNEDQALGADQVLKVTALSYLQEALLGQEYENCAQLVEISKEFGASQGEIRELIAAFLQGDQPGGQSEAKPWKNRLKSLKEKK